MLWYTMLFSGTKHNLRKLARLICEKTKDSWWKTGSTYFESPVILIGPDTAQIRFNHFRTVMSVNVEVLINESLATPGGEYFSRNPWSWESTLFRRLRKAYDKNHTNVVPSKIDALIDGYATAAKQAVAKQRTLIKTLEGTVPPAGALSMPADTQGGQLTLTDEAAQCPEPSKKKWLPEGSALAIGFVLLLGYVLALVIGLGSYLGSLQGSPIDRYRPAPVVPKGAIREYSPKRDAWLKEHFPPKPSVLHTASNLPAEAP